MAIKDKLKKLAGLEQKHGVLGISLNPSDSANAEAVLDFAAEVIEESSRLIKNKSKLRKI
jgi:hypothetical protein